MTGRIILCAVLLGGLPASQANLPSRVEIFTDHDHPVSGVAAYRAKHTAARIDYYTLDAQQRLEAQLNRNLPPDPQQAEAMVKARIGRLESERIGTQLANAFEGIQRAQDYALDRYPAIVFDRAGVVYGVTDLARAARLYGQWRWRHSP